MVFSIFNPDHTPRSEKSSSPSLPLLSLGAKAPFGSLFFQVLRLARQRRQGGVLNVLYEQSTSSVAFAEKGTLEGKAWAEVAAARQDCVKRKKLILWSCD